jgi:hypothetical protein
MTQDQSAPEKASYIPVVSLLEFSDGIGDELLNVVAHLQVLGSTFLKGPGIALQEIAEIQTLLKARDFHSYFEFLATSPLCIYVAAYSATTQADVVAARGDDFFAIDLARKQAFFERVYRETRPHNDVLTNVVQLLGAAIRLDESYRDGWVANLAQAFIMSGMEHFAAQEGAAKFLEFFADVDVRKDKHFQHNPQDHHGSVNKSQVNSQKRLPLSH